MEGNVKELDFYLQMKNQDLQKEDILPKTIQLLTGRSKITAQVACFLQKGPSEQTTAALVLISPSLFCWGHRNLLR